MGWDGPILTDSGGFQVFSLLEAAADRRGGRGVPLPRRRLAADLYAGVVRRGAAGPRASTSLHALDECLAHPATAAETERSLALTERWLVRAIAAHRAAGSPGALFGIVQGGSYEPLRRRAVEAIAALDLPGHAIGGLAVGEPKPVMYDITELVAGLLPADRPRYLMGVGKPPDLIEAVARGVDLFDCVLPTRNARNGQALHARRPAQYQQRAVRPRRRIARRRVPLRGVPSHLAGLSAPPLHGPRAASLPVC